MVMTRTAKLQRKIEYLPIRGEVKAVNDAQGLVEGYLNTTRVVDLGDDRTMPGAFRKTLAESYSRKKAQGLQGLWPYLFNHDYSQVPPGLIVDAQEDHKGLWTRTQLNMDLQIGRDIYNSFKQGSLTSQSMGYKAHQFEYVKENGKSIRNLIEVQIMEGSCVVFPMNTESTITAIKGRQDYNMLLRNKDFATNYQSQQLDDWCYDDFSDLTNALRASIQELFSNGADPLAALETDVLPGLEAALRAYVQAGIDLGYTGSNSSDYGMMSMSGAGGEAKAGYLNATSHARIKEASTMIMKHAKIVASELASLESRNARTRANQLQGFDVYSNASAPSIFEEKEAEADINLQLKLINTRLKVDEALREGKQALIESTPSPTAGVERALARLIESTRR